MNSKQKSSFREVMSGSIKTSRKQSIYSIHNSKKSVKSIIKNDFPEYKSVISGSLKGN